MDFLTFLEKVIGHLTWPVTVFVIIYLFREQFQRLLGRVKSMAYKDTAIEFGDIQKQIEEQSKKRGNIFAVTKDSLTYDNYLDAIMLLSNWYANAVLFIPPGKELDYQRETAIYALEKTEQKLDEAGRKDKTREVIPVLKQALSQTIHND